MRRRPRPDQIAKILREFQADLDAGLSIRRACRKAGLNPAGSTDSRPRHSAKQRWRTTRGQVQGSASVEEAEKAMARHGRAARMLRK
jgi:hypothetical protein